MKLGNTTIRLDDIEFYSVDPTGGGGSYPPRAQLHIHTTSGADLAIGNVDERTLAELDAAFAAADKPLYEVMPPTTGYDEITRFDAEADEQIKWVLKQYIGNGIVTEPPQEPYATVAQLVQMFPEKAHEFWALVGIPQADQSVYEQYKQWWLEQQGKPRGESVLTPIYDEWLATGKVAPIEPPPADQTEPDERARWGWPPRVDDPDGE